MGQYDGYELFDDVADTALRNANQIRVAINVIEDEVVKGRMGMKAVGSLVNYLRALTEHDRAVVATAIRERLGAMR